MCRCPLYLTTYFLLVFLFLLIRFIFVDEKDLTGVHKCKYILLTWRAPCWGVMVVTDRLAEVPGLNHPLFLPGFLIVLREKYSHCPCPFSLTMGTACFGSFQIAPCKFSFYCHMKYKSILIIWLRRHKFVESVCHFNNLYISSSHWSLTVFYFLQFKLKYLI